MIKLFILASVGALIGWMTNVIAIKLLFRPIEPVKIPVLGFTVQGLMPKRKKEIARNIGQTVETELLSIEEIIDRMIEGMDKTAVIEALKKRIVQLAELKMPVFVPSAMKGMIMTFIEDTIDENADEMLNEISEKIVHEATEKVSVALIIEEKINAFPFEKLEEIILSIAKKELKHIEYLGGLIGLVIGFVQGLIILYI
jgi:uncharacterized membrane protein YheB (UPF0754 family)